MDTATQTMLREQARATEPTDFKAADRLGWRLEAAWYERHVPDVYDWAEDIMLNHTTYSRRSYGAGQMYCWADIGPWRGGLVSADGVPCRVDPWPAGNYLRACLLASLCWFRVHKGARLVDADGVELA